MTKCFMTIGALLVAASVVGAQERMVAPHVSPGDSMRTEVFQVAPLGQVRVPFESKVVTGAPYSAETVTESIEVLADGNRIVHRSTGRVYRDGQGRVRREEDRGAGQSPSVFITDPVAQVSYVLEPERKVAIKTTGVNGINTFHTVEDHYSAQQGATVVVGSHLDPAELDRKRRVEEKIITSGAAAEGSQIVIVRSQPLMKVAQGGPAWDEKVEKLPAREIEGVTAEGTRTTRTIPAGAIGNERPISMVTEEWRATDLGVLVLTTTSDPRTGESTYKLTNIVRGEPSASWFEVPAGFSVNETVIKKDFVIRDK